MIIVVIGYEDGVEGINDTLQETHSSVANAILCFSSLAKANLGLRAFNLLLYI